MMLQLCCFFIRMMKKMIAQSVPYFPKKLIWQFSKRYVAGKNLEDVISISKSLNVNGMLVTVDLLGEFISDLQEAKENTEHYLKIITAYQKANIDGSFSLKPTFFGLQLDAETCYLNIRKIVKAASIHERFVRIDMEDATCTDSELGIFEKLQKEFPKNVAIVLQAYLHRTANDLQSLSTLNSTESPINVRLCKGIYVESEKIAFKAIQEIRSQFLHHLEYLFIHKFFAAIATHDKFLVNEAFRLIHKHKVPKDKYEFQMLYGVTPHLRDEIVSKGHKMRIYVPFGKDWFAYCTRRLKENPQIASDIMKALFVKG